MLRINQVSISFPHNGARAEILSKVSFSAEEGEFVTLFGPNGCGKSTLLGIICGSECADSGTVERQFGSSELGFVFQDYRSSLLPWLSVEENILFPLRLRRCSKRLQAERLEWVLSLIPLQAHLSQRIAGLSGGQAQTVALLRALIISPKILILDEPFSALDYSATRVLREQLTRVAVRLGLTVLMVSHDLEEALCLGTKVIFLSSPPTSIVKTLEIPFAYPRTSKLLCSGAFNELRRTAYSVVEGTFPAPIAAAIESRGIAAARAARA